MEMQLPIPIFQEDGKLITRLEYKKPKVGVLTRVQGIVQQGNVWLGMVEFIAGCTVALIGKDDSQVTDQAKIKKLVLAIPYNSAEAVVIKIMATQNEDDVIPGGYSCPDCKTKCMPAYEPESGIDERDRVSMLEVRCIDTEGLTNEILCRPEEPVQFQDTRTGHTIETVESVSIRYPTLADCMSAARKVPHGKDAALQLEIYVQAIFAVNGRPVDKVWNNIWGMQFFNNVYPRDIRQIGDVLESYGIKKTLPKTCQSCGHQWEAPVNTSNFFASGLRPA